MVRFSVKKYLPITVENSENCEKRLLQLTLLLVTARLKLKLRRIQHTYETRLGSSEQSHVTNDVIGHDSTEPSFTMEHVLTRNVNQNDLL